MKKNFNYGHDFRGLQNLEDQVCFGAKSQEMGTFFPGLFSEKKNPRYGYLFLEKLPVNMDMGFALLEAHP